MKSFLLYAITSALRLLQIPLVLEAVVGVVLGRVLTFPYALCVWVSDWLDDWALLSVGELQERAFRFFASRHNS